MRRKHGGLGLAFLQNNSFSSSIDYRLTFEDEDEIDNEEFLNPESENHPEILNPSSIRGE